MMHFSATGKLIQITRTSNTLAKCVLENDFTKLMVMVPEVLLANVQVQDEVYVKGNIKGYEFSNKVYNNLFVQELVKTVEKTILVRLHEELQGNEARFEILKKLSAPATFDEIAGWYCLELSKKADTALELLLNKAEKAKALEVYWNLNTLNVQKKIADGTIRVQSGFIFVLPEIDLFEQVKGDCPLLFFVRKEKTEVSPDPEEKVL